MPSPAKQPEIHPTNRHIPHIFVRSSTSQTHNHHQENTPAMTRGKGPRRDGFFDWVVEVVLIFRESCSFWNDGCCAYLFTRFMRQAVKPTPVPSSTWWLSKTPPAPKWTGTDGQWFGVRTRTSVRVFGRGVVRDLTASISCRKCAAGFLHMVMIRLQANQGYMYVW